MDFELTSGQRMFADSVRGFAQRALAQDSLERARAEINPLMVKADGAGVVAVDALVVRAGDGADPGEPVEEG